MPSAGTRSEVIAALSGDVASAVSEGVGLAIRLVGEAGIGKSTVSSDLADAACSAGATCWSGGASDVSSAEPLSAVLTLRAIGAAPAASDISVRAMLADVLPPAGPAMSASPLADRFTVRERASELIETIGRSSSVVIVEDLHWADPASIDACIAFCEATLTHPVVVVLNHRPVDASSPLGRSIRELDRVGCRRVELGPLGDSEIEELVTRLCGGPPGDALLARVRGAGGNPFLVREYVDGLLAEGGIGALTSGGDESTPVSFRRAVEIELSRLGDEAARTLRAASVIGEPIDVVDLAELTDRSVLDLTDPIEAARSARLIDDTDGSLRFRHDLVRRAVYERMPVPVRAALHRELAGVLSRRGASAGLIGSHLVLGVADEDPEAARMLREAAVDVMVVDPESALQFLDRAVECGPADRTTLRLLHRSRMDALTAAGRLDEAETMLQWLLANAPTADRAELMARGAGMATVAGDNVRAMRWLTDALAEAVDDVDRSPILALCATTWAAARRLDEARDFARRAMELGERVDDPVGRSVGMAMLARMSTYGNDLTEGLELGARSVAIADADTSGAAHSYIVCMHHGMTLFDADRLDEAVDAARHGLRVADQYGLNWTRPLYSALLAAVHFRRGALDEARAEAETSITMGEQMDSRHGLTWALSVAALAAIEQGDVAAAAEWIARGWDTLSKGRGVLGADHLVLAGYRLALVEGRADDAVDWLRVSWEQFVELELFNCLPLIGRDLARAALERGDRALLTEVCRRLEDAASASGVDAKIATAELVHAMVDGDRPRGIEAWRRLSRTEHRLEQAIWLVDHADLVSDDRAWARERALQLLAESGATDRLRSVRGSDDTTDPWAALTGSELAIVRLLATGLTNAQIAAERGTSRRTVESHLGRVYRKLGIDGRVALTVAATTRFGSNE